MPDYRRADVKGATYFFTVNAYRRQLLLVEPKVRAALRAALPFDIHAWVLLPDHLYCIWTLPPSDADFAKRWGMIKRSVGAQCRTFVDGEIERSASRQRRREANFWQRRYWEHLIRDETDLRRHVDYIHWNPVKHGLVARAIDWPYSTFHRYLRAGIYSTEWGVADEHAGQFGE